MPTETILLHPNLAGDKKIQAIVKDELVPLCNRVRKDRGQLQEKWLRYGKIWKAERDKAAYDGRYRTYLAIGRRVIENWVQKVKQDLFPSDNEWFDVVPTREAVAHRIPAIKALFMQYFKKYMRLRRVSTPFLRGLITYGTGPVEIGWRLDERALPTLQEVLDEDGNPTNKFEEKIQTIIKYIGPTFRPVDLFLWYVYPNTQLEVSDASLVFEDMMVDQSQVEALSETPIDPREPDLGMIFENTKDVLERLKYGQGLLGTKDKFDTEIRRLESKGLSSKMDTAEDKNRPLDVTKCHWKRALDDTGDQWWQVVFGADDTTLQVRRNPFWFDEPNFLVGKFVEILDNFYGEGIPGVFDQLQYFLNDVLNQAGDGLVWSMNPICALDMFSVQDPTSIRMRPGAKWLMKDPASSVQFKEPPKETAAIGFTAINQLIALMNDVSNVAPFGGGGLSSGGRSRGRALQTAAGMSIILSEALVQVRDVVTNLEDQVYARQLPWMQLLTEQFLDRPMLLRLTASEGSSIIEGQITRGDVVGDFDYLWLGSTHVHNQEVRATQMVQFGQMVSRIPPEILAQQNVEIGWAYLLRQIWTDGMDLRDGHRVVRDRSQQKVVDPQIENELFRQGQGDEVEVSPGDDDLKHSKAHDQLLGQKLSAPIETQVVAHIRSHMASFMTKKLMEQMQAEQQGAGMIPGVGGGGAPGGGGNGTAPFNPGRPSATGGLDDLFRSLPRIGGMGTVQ